MKNFATATLIIMFISILIFGGCLVGYGVTQAAPPGEMTHPAVTLGMSAMMAGGFATFWACVSILEDE